MYCKRSAWILCEDSYDDNVFYLSLYIVMQFELITEKNGYSAVCEDLGINTHADTFEGLILMMDDALQLHYRVQTSKQKFFQKKSNEQFSLLNPWVMMRF